MRKALFIAAVALIVGAGGTSFGQSYVHIAAGAASGTNAAVIGSGQNAQSQVDVKIPTVILLRVTGTNSTGLPTVTFDFQTHLNAYRNAISAATPSPITWSSGIGSTTLTSVDVLSNTTKASVTATIVAGSTGQLMPASDVYFNNTSGGDTITTSGSGWQQVATSASFAVLPDATIPPGAYSFIVTYTAVSQ